MKQSPDLDRVQKRMRPGVLTLHGFLGTDDRALADIIDQDAQRLHQHGISGAQIAERLQGLTEEGRDLMEQERTVEGRFRITVRDDRGLLPSPFGDGRFEKGDSVLIDAETGTGLLWNPLTLHMIREHGFFGGIGSHYRIDPDTAIRILGLRTLGDQG